MVLLSRKFRRWALSIYVKRIIQGIFLHETNE